MPETEIPFDVHIVETKEGKDTIVKVKNIQFELLSTGEKVIYIVQGDRPKGAKLQRSPSWIHYIHGPCVYCGTSWMSTNRHPVSCAACVRDRWSPLSPVAVKEVETVKRAEEVLRGGQQNGVR